MLNRQPESILSIRTSIENNSNERASNIDLFAPGPAIELHEFTLLNIHMNTGTDVDEVHMSIGDYELSIEPVPGTPNAWRAMHIRPFANQMGVAVIALLIGDELYESRPINIFASKLTYDRAGEYLRFLTKEAEDISALCFSAAKLGSDGKAAQDDIFTRKLDSGINAVRFLIEHSRRFIQDPIFNQQTESSIERYHNHTTIDKKGIDYLASNPHELIKSDPHFAQIKLQGLYFKIENIARQVTTRNLDTYENRVLHYFLNSFDAFLRQAKDQLEKVDSSTRDVITLNNKNYFSFDRLLSDTGLTVKIHASKIDKARHMVLQAKHLFNARLPVSLKTNKPHFPEPTTRALMKGHYRQLFDLARRFYRAEEPEWSGADEFFGLRNLSKIFEIVCLYSLIRSLLNSGAKLESVTYINWDTEAENSRPMNEPFNHFVFRSKMNKRIEIFYEPWIKPRHLLGKSKTGLVDVTHTNSTNNGKPICWRPDFVIKTGEAWPGFHIFDAKYSRYDLVNKKNDGSLSLCTNKYVLGTRVENHSDKDTSLFNSLVNTMHILHSDITRPEYFTHTKPLFNLDRANGDDVIKSKGGQPFTGSFSVSPSETERLDKLIRIITNSLDTK